MLQRCSCSVYASQWRIAVAWQPRNMHMSEGIKEVGVIHTRVWVHCACCVAVTGNDHMTGVSFVTELRHLGWGRDPQMYWVCPVCYDPYTDPTSDDLTLQAMGL